MQPFGTLSKLESWFTRKTGQDIVLLVIVLVFLAGMLPLAATRVFDTMHFERYYTDGALAMLQSNDLLTPRQGDGTLRLRKPLPIYWLLIGSYKLLGVSFFSSRIWFLIAACATIWLAYVVALNLTNDIRVARTTALILLSNGLLIMVGARATPDILVTLALLVSAYGFMRLICHGDTRASVYWSAYGGAAVAIATKGFLPVAFVIYALAFAYFTSSPQRPFRRVLHTGVMLGSILVASSGIILMIWKHGSLFLQAFWGDQFGEKIGFGSSPWRIVAYFLIYVPFLLPWVLCLGYLFYKRKPERPLTEAERKTCAFTLIWAALLPLIFGLGDRIAVRYLLPVMPLLAVVMAINLRRFPRASVDLIINRLVLVIAVVFLAAAAFGVIILWQSTFPGKYFAGFGTLLLTWLLFALLWRRKQFSTEAVLAISFFLFLPLFEALVSPFTLPDQTTQIARELRALNPGRKPVFVIGTNKLSSRLRLSSGNAYPVYEATTADLFREKAKPVAQQSVFILSESEAQRFPPHSFQFQEVAAYPYRISVPKLLQATLRGRAKGYIDNQKRHCYAVLPASS